MGNSHRSVTLSTQLHIQLEYPYYTSGQLMRGVVFLNTSENLVDAALYLTVEGHEKCLWYEGSSLNRRRYYGINHFYREQFVLNNFDQNRLGPGGYAWPFSIELSSNLPGTYESYLNDQTYIRYHVQAELVHYQQPDLSVDYSVPVEIRQPFRVQPSPLEGDMESTPRTWFCCGQGRTKIHVHVSKNVVYTGQALNVTVTVDNKQNNLPVQDVLIDLVQNLFLTANCGTIRTFKHVRKSLKSDGIAPNNESAYTVVVPIMPEDIIAPTSIGTIVANYYTLEVSARPPGLSLCTMDEPYVSSPIYIMVDTQGSLYPLPTPPLGNFTFMRLQQFHATPFVFRQNKRLAVMNYEYGSQLLQ